MDLYKGMRLVAFTSLTFGTASFLVSAWLVLTNRNDIKDNGNGGTNETSCPGQNDHDAASYNHYSLLLRTSIVVVIASLIQVLSGIAFLASPLQGSRRRAKFWFAVNVGLNFIFFLCFIVPIMNRKGQNPSETTDKHSMVDKGQGANCPWSITSTRLDAFYVSVCLDFVIHFLVLVFSLMMLRYDDNRDYELVAII